MRGGGVAATSQYGLEKGAIIIEICDCRNGHAIQSDFTLPEERMQKIIRRRREIRGIQIRPIRLGQFTSDVEFYIRIYVRIVVGGYEKRKITLVHRPYGLVGHLRRLEYRRLYGPRREDIKLVTHSFLRQGQEANNVYRENMSLFVSLGFLTPRFVPVFFLLLRPRPRNLLNTCCSASDTRLEMISRSFSSSKSFSAMFVKIFQPVRRVSRPTVLAPFQRMGLTTGHKPPK